MRQRVAQLVMTRMTLFEVIHDAGVLHRYWIFFHHEVLFRDIGFVAARLVLRQQVIEGLVLVRADLFRDRLVPGFCVGVLRIDIINHPAKTEETVRDDLADIEFSAVFIYYLLFEKHNYAVSTKTL